MIEKAEIEAKAREFEIHTANVERDYVFGWLLAGIYGGASELGKSLILKGGNCFRKAYFAGTRFSNDLDFSTETGVDVDVLTTELAKVCAFVTAKSGVEFYVDRTKVELQQEIDSRRKVYGVRLYFRDFYGNPDKFTISVVMDVTEFDKIHLPVQQRFLIHPYSDSEACRTELRCLKLEEMLATKLKCLLQRRHIADVYDLVYSVFLNQDIEVNRSEVLSTFLRKTIFEPSPGVAKQLILDLPLLALKDAWAKYIVCPVQSRLEFDGAVTNFRGFIEQLFAGYGVGYGALAYFPSSIRNPFMEAASGLKKVRVTYDGITRVVEPYSLVFKRRKDGHGQEYLYVYDTTGGRESGPGIKAFLHGKVGAVEILGETYEPRYPVELAKAGEYADKTYFGSPFSSGRSSGVRRTRVRKSGWVYRIECPYCQRRFTRRTRSTALRRHKDRYDNDCYGRRGSIVDQEYVT